MFYTVNSAISFIVFFNETGLTNASFTKTLFKNGAVDSSLAITVAELSGGYYKATFTPDTALANYEVRLYRHQPQEMRDPKYFKMQTM